MRAEKRAPTTLDLAQRALLVDLLKKRAAADVHALLVLLPHTPQGRFVLRLLLRQHVILRGNRNAQRPTNSSSSCTRCMSICRSTYESFIIRSAFPNEELSEPSSFRPLLYVVRRLHSYNTRFTPYAPCTQRSSMESLGAATRGAHLPSSFLIIVQESIMQDEQTEHTASRSHSPLPQ